MIRGVTTSARNSGDISPDWRKINKFTIQLAKKYAIWGNPVRQIGDRKLN
jgi:hypothetical protein